MSAPVERFAPSPTGRLHLGHAYSALLAWDCARRAGGELRLRIEDLDGARARPEYEDAIRADLRWLGLRWREPVLRQRGRRDAYADALARLGDLGLLYPCTCTRREIETALAAPQEGAGGPVPGGVYPGTCRSRRGRPDGPHALRLDLRAALERPAGRGLAFEELGAAPDGRSGVIPVEPDRLLARCGDAVLARKDFPGSYHLAVVVDDAAQGVTHVTRGEDLFEATPLHRLLQALLGLPAPAYRHHRLVRDADGRRLAKRDGAESLAALRAAGVSPAGSGGARGSGRRARCPDGRDR